MTIEEKVGFESAVSEHSEEEAILDFSDAMSSFASETEDLESSEAEEQDETWGDKRKNYYANDDDDSNVSELSEELGGVSDAEEEEAERMHKLEQSKMSEADFVDQNMTEDGESEAEVESDEKSLDIEALLTEMNDSMAMIKETIVPLLKKVDAEDHKTVKYLRCRHKLLSSYSCNILFYVYLRAEGVTDIQDHPVISTLIKQRVTLEKMKTLDKRMIPMIKKMLDLGKQAESGSNVDASLKYKANPDNMEQESVKTEKYQPPRLAPAFFERETTEKATEKKQRLLEDLQAEFADDPEEIRVRHLLKAEKSTDATDLQRYEEDNFIRLPTSKKEKAQQKDKFVDEIADLDDLLGAGDELEREMKRFSRRSTKIEDEEITSGSDDDATAFIEELQTAKQRKSIQKREENKRKVTWDSSHQQESSKKRPASYQIKKNKGLTPSRKKEVRNPRVKRRNKYESAEKKIKSFKKVATSEAKGGYSGEKTGVKINLTKSVKFD